MNKEYTNFLDYLEKLYQLHELIEDGKGDDEEADKLRDEMDFIKLHPELYKCAELVSAALYKMSDEKEITLHPDFYKISQEKEIQKCDISIRDIFLDKEAKEDIDALVTRMIDAEIINDLKQKRNIIKDKDESEEK